jgi:hypothetical protein
VTRDPSFVPSSIIRSIHHRIIPLRQQTTDSNNQQQPLFPYSLLRLLRTSVIATLLYNHDYSRPLLYLWQGDWQQVGDLLESLASRLFRRVRACVLPLFGTGLAVTYSPSLLRTFILLIYSFGICLSAYYYIVPTATLWMNSA